MQRAWQAKDGNKGTTLRMSYPSRAHRAPVATLHHSQKSL